MEFDEKRKLKRVLYSKPTIVLLVILIVLAARSTWGVYSKAKESEGNYELAEKQLEDLKVRQGNLQAEIDRLSSQSGVEAELRDKFRVAKAGEELAVIVEEEKTAQAEALPPETVWQRVWDWLKK